VKLIHFVFCILILYVPFSESEEKNNVIKKKMFEVLQPFLKETIEKDKIIITYTIDGNAEFKFSGYSNLIDAYDFLILFFYKQRYGVEFIEYDYKMPSGLNARAEFEKLLPTIIKKYPECYVTISYDDAICVLNILKNKFVIEGSYSITDEGETITRAIELFEDKTNIRINEQLPCDMPELTTGDGSFYHELACDGKDAFYEGKYEDAIKNFEEAVMLDFMYEVNVRLYSRLALAYHFSGNQIERDIALKKARLSIEILTGEIQCTSEASKQMGLSKDGKILTGEVEKYIFLKMCKEKFLPDYPPYYEFEHVYEIPFYRIYLDVKQKIESEL